MDLFRRSRHNMLYGVDVSAVEEDARQGILAAEELLSAVVDEMKRPAQRK